MKRTINNLPELPAEAGECSIEWGMPRRGLDWTPCGSSWLLAVYEFAHPTLIARPIKPKRLEWDDFIGVSCASKCKRYTIAITCRGEFRGRCGEWDSGVVTTVHEAVDICQRHADEQERLTVETSEIHWPAGSILLTKDDNGHMNTYSPTADGCWNESAYRGPDPFPPGTPWIKCFIINPAVLKKA